VNFLKPFEKFRKALLFVVKITSGVAHAFKKLIGLQT